MAEEKVGFFRRLVNGLSKTRDSIVAGIDSIFSGYSSIDDDFYDEIEEILVMGDIGITTTTKIIEKLKERVLDARVEGYTRGLSEMSDDLEHLKSVLRENGIFIIPPKYPWEKSGWNMP